jgi:hypothetical protein
LNPVFNLIGRRKRRPIFHRRGEKHGICGPIGRI